MVKMEPLLQQPTTKFEFLKYLKKYYGFWPGLLAYYGYEPTLAGLETFLADSSLHVEPAELAALTLLSEYDFEPTLADLETSPYLLQWFEEFQSGELSVIYKEYYQRIGTIEVSFDGDWRKGQEFHKVVITQRLYQTSPNSTQA